MALPRPFRFVARGVKAGLVVRYYLLGGGGGGVVVVVVVVVVVMVCVCVWCEAQQVN